MPIDSSGIDFDLIRSIGPSFLQGAMTRAQLQALEEKRQREQIELLLKLKEREDNAKVGDAMLSSMGLLNNQGPGLGAAMGIAPQGQLPISPADPVTPPLIRRPGPEYQTEAGAMTIPDMKTHLGIPQDPPEQVSGMEEIVSKSINSYLNAPSQTGRMAAIMYRTGERTGAVSMWGKFLEEKKDRIAQVNQAMERLVEASEKMSPEQWNELGAPLMKAAYPEVFGQIPDEILRRGTGLQFEYLTDKWGNVTAKAILGRGKTKTEFAETEDRLAGAYGRKMTPEEVITAGSTKGVNVTVGGPGIEKSTKGKAEEDVQQAVDLYTGMENLVRLAKPEFLTYMGQGQAWIERVGEKAKLWSNPKLLGGYTEWKVSVEQEFNKYRKWVTGVAAGPVELEMIRKTFPNADMSETQFMSAVRTTARQAYKFAERKRRAILAGIYDEKKQKDFYKLIPLDSIGEPPKEFMQQFERLSMGTRSLDSFDSRRR